MHSASEKCESEVEGRVRFWQAVLGTRNWVSILMIPKLRLKEHHSTMRSVLDSPLANVAASTLAAAEIVAIDLEQTGTATEDDIEAERRELGEALTSHNQGEEVGSIGIVEVATLHCRCKTTEALEAS